MVKCYVKGQRLDIKQPLIVTGTLNYIEVSVDFATPDWNGLSKWIHFVNTPYEVVKQLDENNQITADCGLDLTTGDWTVWIHGTSASSTGENIVRITTNERLVTVDNTGMAGDHPLPELKPNVAEQLDAKLQNTIDVLEKVRVPAGGKTDQVLAKKSDVDNDVEWKTLSGSGSGGASKWSELTDKPFNTLNPDEFVVSHDQQLDIKAVPQSKVTGLKKSLDDKANTSDIKPSYIKSELPPEDKGTIWVDPNGECPTPSPSAVVDTEMSDTSENAVQNKVIKSYVDSVLGGISTLVGGGF